MTAPALDTESPIITGASALLVELDNLIQHEERLAHLAWEGGFTTLEASIRQDISEMHQWRAAIVVGLTR